MNINTMSRSLAVSPGLTVHMLDPFHPHIHVRMDYFDFNIYTLSAKTGIILGFVCFNYDT